MATNLPEADREMREALTDEYAGMVEDVDDPDMSYGDAVMTYLYGPDPEDWQDEKDYLP